jgi:HAD superfamily hydrolase (TIGR01484 family)
MISSHKHLKMRPFRDYPVAKLKQIQMVLSDIDDTLTKDGKLPASSLKAMEDLSMAGVRVIPVTGRPAGWCDHIARMWPVDAVIGENGAFYFSYDRVARKMRSHYVKAAAERARDRKRLHELEVKILETIPGAALASDQLYRIADLAIDFCEDVPPLPSEEVRRIVEILTAGGATTKVSSIHVNAWFGEYDKLTTTRSCLRNLFGMEPLHHQSSIIYMGDSPNDSPMFACFENSIGVANVRNFNMPHFPKWVTAGESADGFLEVASALLIARI